MARQSKAEKAIDKRIESAYYANCSGVAINIMDIEKVFAAGRAAILAGADDAALGEKLRAVVDTLRMVP